MFEQFTDEARKAMALANQEAQRFNHEYIGTEHLLLGLIKQGKGKAVNYLKQQDYTLNRFREEVEKLVISGPDMVTMGKLPQTPRAKEVIKAAIKFSRSRNDNRIDTEHLLYGIFKVKEGVAAQVLKNLGFKEEGLEEMLDQEKDGKEKSIQEIKGQDLVGYWRIPKKDMDLATFLHYQGVVSSSSYWPISEKCPSELSLYFKGSDVIGVAKQTSKDPLRYDSLTLKPKRDSLTQLRNLAEVKSILDENKIKYDIDPSLEEVANEIRELGILKSREYKDVANLLEGKLSDSSSNPGGWEMDVSG
jgi:hypothetical protein